MLSRIKDIISRYTGGMGKAIVLNILYKPLSMLFTLLYTPILLSYLGDESYGVWITIASIISWINYFDLGIGNGMRNVLAYEVSKQNYKRAQTIVSTGYCVLSCISFMVCIIVGCATLFVNTDALLNTNFNTKYVVIITVFFVCINFILSLCKAELFADQNSDKVALISVCINGINLIGIYVLTLVSSSNLLIVAILNGLSMSLVNIIFSVILWRKKKYYMPKIRHVDIKSAKQISSLGLKFFVLQIGCLIIYSTDNLIITRLFSPTLVTPYNTVYKVFNIVLVMFTALISPLWSRITVESARNNFIWIRSTIKKLNIIMIPISMLLFVLGFYFRDIAYLWLHKSLHYENGLILCMGLNFGLNILSSIYSAVLNGMSELNIQLYVSVLIAVLNIPLSIYLAKDVGYGVTGVILATVICMVISTVTIVIQTYFVLNKKQANVKKYSGDIL